MAVSASDPLSEIVSSQLESLDDADHLASAWSDAVEDAAAKGHAMPKWGGRGRGGRGLSRRTFQPHDVVLENVSLEYVHQGPQHVAHRTLLDGTSKLKLLPSRIYALVGRNGYGKSTLLRRIHGKKMPGFPTHLSTFYVPQEVTSMDLTQMGLQEEDQDQDQEGQQVGSSNEVPVRQTPLQIVLARGQRVQRQNEESNRLVMESLEAQLEALDASQEGAEEEMERLCSCISQLQDEADEEQTTEARQMEEEALDALEFFGFDRTAAATQSMECWTGGWRKRVLLAAILVFDPDLVLLDEPTNHMDVAGILQLRRLLRLCRERQSTVLLVSHDLDLLNEVPTDVIHWHQQQLTYYPGTHRDFIGYRAQALLHSERQAHALDKQRKAMMESIDYQRRQNAAQRGDKSKNNRTIASRKKKLERHGVERDEHGHRWSAQKAGTGIRPGSINSVDATTRKNATTTQLLSNRPETQITPVVDKEVQFVFPQVTSFWAGPLIMAMDVGHGYPAPEQQGQAETQSVQHGSQRVDMLFDCVDLSIDEGSVTCILGANGSGKSTLLRLLAGLETPLQGKVTRAHLANVAYIGQHVADDILVAASVANASAATVASALSKALARRPKQENDKDEEEEKEKEESSSSRRQDAVVATPLSVLEAAFPTKKEQELRGELTAFGLNPQQATTNVRFLSGGERSRLCLAMAMLQQPQVLLLDEPTNHLDPESVEALATGLVEWNGTVVLVTHDAHLIRRVGGTCWVLTGREDGKLRRIPGGIDYYLKGMAAGANARSAVGGRGGHSEEQ